MTDNSRGLAFSRSTASCPIRIPSGMKAPKPQGARGPSAIHSSGVSARADETRTIAVSAVAISLSIGAAFLHAKKRAGRLSPAPQIVSTLFPLSGFDLDLRATLLDARQGSSRDLDHQSASRPNWGGTRRLNRAACHHFRQRLFKLRAFAETIGN